MNSTTDSFDSRISTLINTSDSMSVQKLSNGITVWKFGRDGGPLGNAYLDSGTGMPIAVDRA